MKALQKIKTSHVLDDVMDKDEQITWAHQSGCRNIFPVLFLGVFVTVFFLLFSSLTVYAIVTGKVFDSAFLLSLFLALFLGWTLKVVTEKIIEAYNIFYVVTNKRAILIETEKQQKKITVFSKADIANCNIIRRFWGMTVLFKDTTINVVSSYKFPTSTSIRGVGFENVGKYDFVKLMTLLNELTETDKEKQTDRSNPQ
jgi:hypothetical protein